MSEDSPDNIAKIKDILMDSFKKINKSRVTAATIIGSILFCTIIGLYIRNKINLKHNNCEVLKYVNEGKPSNLQSISIDVKKKK